MSSEIVACPACSTRVMPMQDGRCPSCRTQSFPPRVNADVASKCDERKPKEARCGTPGGLSDTSGASQLPITASCKSSRDSDPSIHEGVVTYYPTRPLADPLLVIRLWTIRIFVLFLMVTVGIELLAWGAIAQEGSQQVTDSDQHASQEAESNEFFGSNQLRVFVIGLAFYCVQIQIATFP